MTIKNPHIDRKRDYDPATGKKREPGASPAFSQISKRKRGAQPGNDNARRYGFYSKSFSPSDMEGLDSNVTGEFHDELNAARVHAAHLAELMKDYRNMPLQDYISASNAFNNYLDRIQSLTRAQRFIYQNQTTIEKALEELKDIPPEAD